MKRGRPKLPDGVYSFNYLFGSYKWEAGNRGLTFELSKENFKLLTKQDCYYCGIKPYRVIYGRHASTPYVYNGIDRRNNNEGYTVTNSVACCKTCNLAKRDLTEKEFYEWIERIMEYQSNGLK